MTSASKIKEVKVQMDVVRLPEVQLMKGAVTDCRLKLDLKLKVECELKTISTNQKD